MRTLYIRINASISCGDLLHRDVSPEKPMDERRLDLERRNYTLAVSEHRVSQRGQRRGGDKEWPPHHPLGIAGCEGLGSEAVDERTHGSRGLTLDLGVKIANREARGR